MSFIGRRIRSYKDERRRQNRLRSQAALIRGEAYERGVYEGARREGYRQGIASQKQGRGGRFGRVASALSLLIRDVGDLGFGGGYDPLTGELRSSRRRSTRRSKKRRRR